MEASRSIATRLLSCHNGSRSVGASQAGNTLMFDAGALDFSAQRSRAQKKTEGGGMAAVRTGFVPYAALSFRRVL